MGCADNRLKTQIGTVPCNKGMYYFESHQSQLGGGGDWFNRRAVAKLNVCGVFLCCFLLHMDTLITKRLLYHFGCAIQRDRRLIAFKSHVPCPDTALADPCNGYGWNVPVLSLRCSSISLLSSSAEECTKRERRTVCSHLRVTDTLTTLFCILSTRISLMISCFQLSSSLTLRYF